MTHIVALDIFFNSGVELSKIGLMRFQKIHVRQSLPLQEINELLVKPTSLLKGLRCIGLNIGQYSRELSYREF